MSEQRRQAMRDEWARAHGAEQQRRAAQSTSSAGWMLSWFAFGFMLAGLTLATVPLLSLLPAGVLHLLVIEGTTKALPIYSVFYAVPLLVVPRLLVPRAFTAELQRVNALPFTVEGYEEALGRYPKYRLGLALDFVAQPPPKELVAQLLEEPMVTWDVKANDSRGELVLERDPGLGQTYDDTNRRLVLWFRRFATPKLLELHARHPLATVTFLSP